MEKKQILLTNDDGIRSPGLWAAAEALSKIGFVQVVAPREQSSGTGRSLPTGSDGVIGIEQVSVGGQTWEVYAVGGTPAQAVQHGVLEVLPGYPDLVVSGINYGENVGSGVTISGTVGAALEAAALGIPALAISLETKQEHHLSYSMEVDFATAAYFCVFFGERLLAQKMPADVHVLKVDIPINATPETPWRATRVSMQRYYFPDPPVRDSWDKPARIGYYQGGDLNLEPEGTDVHAIRVEKIVSVTPLSLDITSRVSMPELEQMIRGR